MQNFRTEETFKKLEEWKKNFKPGDPCPLCNGTAIKDFKYWRIIQNNFPYDKIATLSHILVLNRHEKLAGINREEAEELESIRRDFFENNYDLIMDVGEKRKSIPDHYHLHLLIQK